MYQTEIRTIDIYLEVAGEVWGGFDNSKEGCKTYSVNGTAPHLDEWVEGQKHENYMRLFHSLADCDFDETTVEITSALTTNKVEVLYFENGTLVKSVTTQFYSDDTSLFNN